MPDKLFCYCRLVSTGFLFFWRNGIIFLEREIPQWRASNAFRRIRSVGQGIRRRLRLNFHLEAMQYVYIPSAMLLFSKVRHDAWEVKITISFQSVLVQWIVANCNVVTIVILSTFYLFFVGKHPFQKFTHRPKCLKGCLSTITGQR